MIEKSVVPKTLTCNTDRTLGPLIAATKPVKNTVARNMNGMSTAFVKSPRNYCFGRVLRDLLTL
jgi:hypothetical protein